MSDYKNKWEEYKAKNGATPLDLFKVRDQNITHAEMQRRYDICKGCPMFVGLTKQCRECGCFMGMKVKIDKARCPLGHWEPYEGEPEEIELDNPSE